MKSFALAAAISLFAGVAHATTVDVSFSTYLTGQDLGNSELATLSAQQVGDDVLMTFTNTAISQTKSFETQLFLAYSLPQDSSVGLVYQSGVAVSDFQTNAGDIVNAGQTFDLLVEWGTSNAGGGVLRLQPGESSTFLLTNALVSNLFEGSGRSPYAMIHIQGLDGGGSAKYTGSVSPVPLPPAVALLASGLGLLGLSGLRIRRKRQTPIWG